MRTFYWLLLLLSMPFAAAAQHSITGKVIDKSTGEGLAGANIILQNSFKATATNMDGNYQITGLSPGRYTLIVSYVGYKSTKKEVSLDSDKKMDIVLSEQSFLAEEIIVTATRASDKTPTTYTEVTKADLQLLNFGQDMPVLLNQTPSVVVTSDAGAGVGYAGLRIRGSDITRINVTVNGIPINDPESHGVFWVNMPDFASSVNNIQLQRGVGTSTNGAAAFGASINIQTDELQEEAYAEVNNSAGSFNTFRHTVKVGTGLINNRFAVDARLSKISSDGYLDRASSDLKSFFVSAGYYGENTLLKLNVFSGQERTYQAWNGSSQSEMDTYGRTFNGAGALYDDEWNVIGYYDNQVDNYQQDHYQLIFAQQAGSKLTINSALHYTRGRGYFEEYRQFDRLSTYNIQPAIIGNDTIVRSDLIRRRWLDNHFYGLTFSADYKPNSKLNLILGGGINRYDGDHFGEVIWARNASNSEIRHQYYDNNGLKDDFNIYGKAFYNITNDLSGFVDLQYRRIDYRIRGVFDRPVFSNDMRFNFDFFNPKFGLMYQLANQGNIFASYSISNREPVRRDFVDAPANTDPPTAERLNNLEVGYRNKGSNFSYEITYYHMAYTNQLVLTGEISDVGSYLRQNAGESYRTGVELAGVLKISDMLSFSGNISWNSNIIKSYSEQRGDSLVTYTNQPIAFSPDWVGATTITFKPIANLEFNLLSKYVGSQFMDNSGRDLSKLDGFFVNDFRASYRIFPRWMEYMEFGVLINNVFNEKFASNGYMWGDTRYFYPQAGRNFLANLTLRF
ncbi:MAG: TonB-dependent receptor [Cyclobacteriaceae bacterium]